MQSQVAPDVSSPEINVLVNDIKDAINKSFSPVDHQLAAIAPSILFLSPIQRSRTFPTIKSKITSSNGHTYLVEALLDSGATATYINRSFVEDHSIPTRKLANPMYARNSDGTLHSRSITHEARFTSLIQDHKSTEWFYVAELGDKDMIIGMTWLQSHNPIIDWRTGKVEFTRCPGKCGGAQQAVNNLHHLFEAATTFGEHDLNRVEFSNTSSKHGNLSTQMAIDDMKTKKVLTLDDVRKGPFADFIDVFEEKGYQELPPHRIWDHKIDLVPDWEQRVWKPHIYPLTHDEQKELDKFLDENLKNGRIRPSESPLASPVFFINKKTGDKRMVIDYRKVNGLTQKNSYPLPLIDPLLTKWKGCLYFSALDVRSGYYNIRMREGDEWKTAFITNRGLFESLVMTFGLCNAPATFQTMMDSIFIVYIRRGDTGAFIDDVGIGTGPDPTGKLSPEEFHIKVCREILAVFRKHHLSLKPEKCVFLQKEIRYLGHIISGEALKPDPVKLDGVRQWPVPTTLKQLRSFLGFLNYYRRFISGFSELARPLNDLLRNDVQWKWETPQHEAFERLKQAMLTAPVLAHPSDDKPFILETDASDVAYGAVLSQEQDDGKYKPLGYLSKTLSPAERNYVTADKEMLAIIRGLENWRHLLVGSKHEVTVLTDHANLQYFRTKQPLNSRQMRWALWLDEQFKHLVIRYRPGRQSNVPDALSRRSDHGEGESREQKKLIQLLPNSYFPEDPVPPKAQEINTAELSPPTLSQEFYVAQSQDPLILKFNMTKEGESLPANWHKNQNDLWCYWNKIYVPSPLRQTVFRLLHSNPTAGHPGRDATLFNIRRSYYWPNLKSDIEEWVRNCDICQRTKVIHKKPHGELKPIDPTPRPWGVITSDLITGLPPCHGYDSIWTVTDKRTKMIHIHETKSTLDAEGLYHLYLKRVFSAHGTPDKVITDRGPQYSSRFARDANKNLVIETAMSTAYHPQTDGQSERTNQEVEQVLRTVISFHQDDWVDWLPVVEFALNNRFKRALKTTPFYANYGFHPQIGSLPKVNTPVISVEAFVEHIQQVQKDTTKALEQAAVDMKRFYDRFRSKAPDFEVGQKVLLDNADLAINRPSRKLAERRSGPFEILEKIGTHAYRLKLPSQWKTVHPVFHVSKIEPYREDPDNPNFPSPPPDVIEGEPEWEVEKILDSMFAHGVLKYFVKWKGWPESESNWEPEENLVNAPEIIAEFHRSHPGAPRRLPTGGVSGQSLTKKTRKKRKKTTRLRELSFQPLRQQTDVENWPNGPMSRDATF
jgi:hypothetical protein